MRRIRPIEDADVAPVVALCEARGLTRPWNPREADIARGIRERAFVSHRTKAREKGS